MTHKYAQLNDYATSADFCRIFVEQVNSLYLLSLLLTADPQKAEQCYLSGVRGLSRRSPYADR